MKKNLSFILFINKFINDLLIASLITFIVFQALENLKTGLISNYFDLNLLLIIAGSCLITSVFLVQDRNYSKKLINLIFYLFFAIIILLLLLLNLKLLFFWRIILVGILLVILIIFYRRRNNDR